MSLTALIRLLRVTNWDALPDGKGMRQACISAILERLQETDYERALRSLQFVAYHGVAE